MKLIIDLQHKENYEYGKTIIDHLYNMREIHKGNAYLLWGVNITKRHDKGALSHYNLIALCLYASRKGFKVGVTISIKEDIEVISGFCDFIRLEDPEINNIPLLKEVNRLELPVIVQCGLSIELLNDIYEVIHMLKDCKEIILTLSFLTLQEAVPLSSGINQLARFKRLSTVKIGFYDNYLDDISGYISLSKGLDYLVFPYPYIYKTTDPLVDYLFKLQRTKNFLEAEIQSYILDIQTTKQRIALKSSCVYATTLNSGVVLDFKNVKMVRNGEGLSWKDTATLFGKKLRKKVLENESIKRIHFKGE